VTGPGGAAGAGVGDVTGALADVWPWVLAVAHRSGPGLVVEEDRERVSVRNVDGVVLEVDVAGAWRFSGPVTPEAQAVFDLYLPISAPRTFVVAQVGQSLDGRVATSGGHAHYVTGDEDLRRLHRVRALVDAVLVGAGTADADDPQLTVRRATGPNPLRVVLDPRGRVPAERRVFQDGAAPTLWLRRGSPPLPVGAHVDVVSPPEATRDLPPGSVLDLLAARGVRRVLVEGGGNTVSRFLAAGALHRLHVTVAPLLIGEGPHGLPLPPVETLDQALRPPSRTYALGQDVLFDLRLQPARSLA